MICWVLSLALFFSTFPCQAGESPELAVPAVDSPSCPNGVIRDGYLIVQFTRHRAGSISERGAYWSPGRAQRSARDQAVLDLIVELGALDVESIPGTSTANSVSYDVVLGVWGGKFRRLRGTSAGFSRKLPKLIGQLTASRPLDYRPAPNAGSELCAWLEREGERPARVTLTFHDGISRRARVREYSAALSEILVAWLQTTLSPRGLTAGSPRYDQDECNVEVAGPAASLLRFLKEENIPFLSRAAAVRD
jgi:hypothetical protein